MYTCFESHALQVCPIVAPFMLRLRSRSVRGLICILRRLICIIMLNRMRIICIIRRIICIIRLSPREGRGPLPEGGKSGRGFFGGSSMGPTGPLLQVSGKTETIGEAYSEAPEPPNPENERRSGSFGGLYSKPQIPEGA